MNNTNIPIGTTVYVNWYGKVVPAEVIDRNGHNDWQLVYTYRCTPSDIPFFHDYHKYTIKRS